MDKYKDSNFEVLGPTASNALETIKNWAVEDKENRSVFIITSGLIPNGDGQRRAGTVLVGKGVNIVESMVETMVENKSIANLILHVAGEFLNRINDLKKPEAEDIK